MGRDASDTALPRVGLVLLAALTLGWGLNWTSMKIALTEILPWTFRIMLTPAAGVILLAIARSSGMSLAVPRHQWAALTGLALFNVTGWMMFAAYGIGIMTSGRAAVIAFTMPVWASILSAIFLGETLNRRRAGALALGMGGIGVLLAGTALGGSLLGPAYMLAAALSWAIGVVWLKGVAWQVATLPLAGWQLLVGAIPIVVLGPAVETVQLGAISWLAIAAVLFTLLWPMCFCHWAFIKVVSLFPASVSAIGTLLVPVVGVFSGALLLGEPLGWREVTALALVCASLALELLRPVAAPSPEP